MRSRKQDGEIILDYPGGTNLITGVLKRGGTLPSCGEKERCKGGGRVRDGRLPVLKLEEGGRGPRNAGGSNMLGKQGRGFSPLQSPKGTVALPTHFGIPSSGTVR